MLGTLGIVGRGEFDAPAAGPQGPKGDQGGLERIEQTRHGLSVLQCIRYDIEANGFVLARADSNSTLALGVVVEVKDANNFTYSMAGRFAINHNLPVDSWLYLSADEAGELTEEIPLIEQPIVCTDDNGHLSIFPYRPSSTRASPEGEAAEGPEGPAGPQGMQGQPGNQGPRGFEGPTGPQGIPGTGGGGDGSGGVGPEGPRGPQGDMGNKGADGIAGPQGPRGEKGVQGIEGLKGDAGTDGIDGSAGADGSDGRVDDFNLDGGAARTVYTAYQLIQGGAA